MNREETEATQEDADETERHEEAATEPESQGSGIQGAGTG